MRPWAVGVGAILIVATTGCGHAMDDAAYRESGSQAVQSARSETATAHLAVQAWLDGKLTGQAAGVIVDDAQGALDKAATGFSTAIPASPGQDRTRDELTLLLNTSSDALTRARIALSRNDLRSARAASNDLDAIGDELESEGLELR